MKGNLLAVFANQMENQRYTILVMGFTFGQYRIQLTDVSKPDRSAPPGHGTIVREMCTYDEQKLNEVLDKLRSASDPEAAAESFSKPWNCEGPGGRIRLDTELKDNPYRAERANQ